jgi:hypothetical protein
MRTISLEHFYSDFERTLRLVEAYTEQKDLAFIMRACRLKPQPLLSGKPEGKTILHKWWFDEHGNSFKIIKNKRIRLIFNDLKLNRERIIGTDLYECLPIDKVAKMAKLIYLLSGKDEDTLEPHITISFLGVDNFLRTYALAYGEWKAYPSLNLGMNVLKSIAKYRDVKYYRELVNREPVLYPCKKQKSWISFYPLPKDFVALLKEQNEFVLDVLNINKGK